MNRRIPQWITTLIAIGFASSAPPPRARADSPSTRPAQIEKSINAANGLKILVKQIGPADQNTDLQIICILKHNPAGDTYIEAMETLNNALGKLISTLRDRGDFIGDAGETILITPPANTIVPKRLLLIGVGDEKTLTLDTLALVGRIAARESLRLGVSHVSFAPTLRDQGSTRLEVADGDVAVVRHFLRACDTERSLQAHGLAPKAEISDFTIEAGPRYFDAVVEKVSEAASVLQH